MKDLVGQKFGRLMAVNPVKVEGYRSYYWECRCDCGNVITVYGGNLKRGNTQSCGCFKKDKSRERMITHGLIKSPIYKIWIHIKDRCFNENNHKYKNYGGRGIKVCERWLDFKNFHDDMTPTYQKGLSIDRIDNNGNYEPSNCKWSTRKEQSNNRRSNRILEFNGEKKTISIWAKEFNINYNVLQFRINKGWSIEKSLTTPVRYKSPYNK